MSNREVKFDNGWIPSASPVNAKLFKKGYSVGGYIDKGVPKYVLYRADDVRMKFERIHEFDTAEELNNMVKLLIEEGD